MACISQTRISELSSPVTDWPPTAVNRTESPSDRWPAPSRSTSPRATNKCRYGASGKVTDRPGARRATWSVGVPVGDADRRLVGVFRQARSNGNEPARKSGVIDLELPVTRRQVGCIREDPHCNWIDDEHSAGQPFRRPSLRRLRVSHGFLRPDSVPHRERLASAPGTASHVESQMHSAVGAIQRISQRDSTVDVLAGPTRP